MSDMNSPPGGRGDASAALDRPSMWSRKSVLGSAGLVAVLVVAGLIITLINIFGGGNASPAVTGPSATGPVVSTATSAVTTSSPSSAVEASVCGLPSNESSGSVAAAPPATWSLVGTTAAPTVKGVGPGTVETDGYRSCYAHTPTGALVAAANLVAMGSVPTLQPKVNQGLVVPGPGRDKVLSEPVSGGGQTGVRIQIVGFRVLRYDGKSADIDIAIRTSKGAVAGQVFNLQWSGGDWKVQITPNGDLPVPIVQLPDVTGYIPWSGA